MLNEIKHYLDFSKDKEFAEYLGVKPNTLHNWYSRNTFDTELIYTKCNFLNPSWLLTGEGAMLTTKKDALAVPTEKEKGIPLVSIEAIGGFGNIEFSIADRDVKDYYVVPKFKERKIDFMIEVYGSSMYPKYNSGDVVACKKISESNFIQWNKVHVIATKEQGILIKRLKKSDDENFLLAISDNKDYDPFLIPKDEITGVALVVGVIRLE